MALRAQLVALAPLRDVDAQRERIWRSVRHMATGAGDRTSLEAAAYRQRLRAVESIRPSIRPEFALQIRLWNRRTNQERQGEILVATSRREVDEGVLLVAVTVAARIKLLTR